MPYTTNPHLPKVRARAISLVREQGWSVRQVAAHLGFHRATVYDWLGKAPTGVGHIREIPTQSTRPHTSPRAIPPALVERIVALRRRRGRCARAIHAQLMRDGVRVSFSTVHRTIVRHGLVRTRSPWKRLHRSGARPRAASPGALLQMDSIHRLLPSRHRHYLLTLIDVYSRWAYARALPAITAPASVQVVGRARRSAPFAFQCIQTDHGSEFSTHFTQRLAVWRIQHRHGRVRQPNDQAHVERFNRTLQEELRTDLIRYQDAPTKLNHSLRAYLTYYNTERLHLGIAGKTPQEMLELSGRC